MSWRIKDEWVDPVECQHVVLFHNPDYGPDHPGHQLIHLFGPDHGPITITDMEKRKAEELAKLHAHARQLMDYSQKHQQIRRGRGPKK